MCFSVLGPGSRPSISIYQPWLIKIANNKSQRLDIMLLFLLLASWAKWLIVRLRTKWLWVWVQLYSFKLQILHLFRARSSLTFRQLYPTIACGFTLKYVRDMIRTFETCFKPTSREIKTWSYLELITSTKHAKCFS